jgi:hypothetical protein
VETIRELVQGKEKAVALVDGPDDLKRFGTED